MIGCFTDDYHIKYLHRDQISRNSIRFSRLWAYITLAVVQRRLSRRSFPTYKVTFWTPTLQYRIPHLYLSSRKYSLVLSPAKLVMKFTLSAALLSLASFATASVLPRQSCPEASRFGNLIVTSPSGATSYNAGDASPHFFLLSHSHLWTVVCLAHPHPRWPHLCHQHLRNYTKVHGLHHPSPPRV